jgi:hypothetical protein
MSLQVPQLPAVINALVREDEKKDVLVQCDNDEKIIIIYTKKISEDDMNILKQYGTVVKFNSSLINVPLDTIQANYIVADGNDKVALENVERFYENRRFKFVHYGFFFEEFHFSDINTVKKFKLCKDRADFNHTLLCKKQLERPNKLFSCLNFLVHMVESLKA